MDYVVCETRTSLVMTFVFLAHFFPNEFEYFGGHHAARNLLQV